MQNPTPQSVAAEIKALPARSAPADLKRVLHHLLELIVATQTDIDAITTAVNGAVTNINAAVTDVTNEIAALKQANPSLDLTGLQNAVSALGTAVGGLQNLDAANKPTGP